VISDWSAGRTGVVAVDKWTTLPGDSAAGRRTSPRWCTMADSAGGCRTWSCRSPAARRSTRVAGYCWGNSASGRSVYRALGNRRSAGRRAMTVSGRDSSSRRSGWAEDSSWPVGRAEAFRVVAEY